MKGQTRLEASASCWDALTSLSITYDVVPTNAHVDSQSNVLAPKRAASEIDSIEPESESPKPAKAARQGRKPRTRGCGTKASNGPRVGCPFSKEDPKSHAQTMACRGIGFDNIGKVKYVSPFCLTCRAQYVFTRKCFAL
jgi:hypothetical protein